MIRNSSDQKLASVIISGIALFCLLPFIILFLNFEPNLQINHERLFEAITTSILQSVSTVILCLILAIFNYKAFFYFSLKTRNLLKKLCLLPVIFPSMFVILYVFSIFNPFPFGTLGIVAIFFATYVGYSFVTVAGAVEKKIGQSYLVAKIYGLSEMTILFRVVFPMIKVELNMLALVIFCGCFSSLSIPMIASGGKSTSFELFIYQTLFVEGNWGGAIVLALIQSFFLLLLGLFVNQISHKESSSLLNETYLKTKLSAGIVCGFLASFIGIYLYRVIVAFFNVNWKGFNFQELFFAFINSISIFFALVSVFLLILLGLVYSFYYFKNSKVLRFFLSPSSTLVGFALYISLPTASFSSDIFKASFGLFLLSSFTLFFNFVEPRLAELQSQILVARIYNVAFFEALKKIVWPQAKQQILFVVSVLFLLSLTEFAIFKSAGVQFQTFGTLLYSFMSSYRLDGAYVLSFFALSAWLLVLFLFNRSNHVFD